MRGARDIQAIMKSSQFKWKPYQSMMADDIYNSRVELVNSKKRLHEANGANLWFRESTDAAFKVLEAVLDKSIQIISLCAEPGAGKTAVIHNLIYQLITHIDPIVPSGNISLTTGMSDTEWYDQIINTFNVSCSDPEPMWSDVNAVNTNYCVTHRQNFKNRIKYLMNNSEKLSNHVFIIDESHFADEKKHTFGKLFENNLGLTIERMQEYNIKIILVSATPDVSLSALYRSEKHRVIQLRNGDGYMGFDYFYRNGMIKEFSDDIEGIIRSNYTRPRYHFIRARANDSRYRAKVMRVCHDNGWEFKEDDSNNYFYISHVDDECEYLQKNINGKNIITTYIEPPVHTVILLKDKYRASKRLKLTKFVGIISEKPAKKNNTTVTCNGLIPRFFGYDKLPEYVDGERSLFYCALHCVKEYIQFCKDFVYKGVPYNSDRVRSNGKTLVENGSTLYSEMDHIEPRQMPKNPDPTVYVFKTFQEVKTYMHKLGKIVHSQEKNKNAYGFYEATIRGEKRVYSREELNNDKKWGLNGSNHRVHPCYADVNDKSTLEWWLKLYLPN